MIKQTTVAHIQRQHIPRENTHIVVAMCFYPRGLKKDLRDEYRRDLAPDVKLFKDWQKFEKEFGHELAFQKSDYENRFTLSPAAVEHLGVLCEISQKKDVYLVCQCRVSERCHREILMLTAQKLFGAKTSMIYHKYPDYERRLAALEFKK
jgi:uncharacterized protein YeaO (DUF488 family)